MITLEPINREILRAELERDEGFRAKTYRCTAGKLSIGVGRNLDDVGIRPSETAALKITLASVKAKGITRAQAMVLLDNDIDECLRQLARRLPWVESLDQVRKRVLVNMCFNLGISKLLGFKNTLAMIQRGDFKAAAAGMLQSLWASQVGARATRLSELMKLGPKK
ncbi:glycoside hydrolase family protein [Novosphingobium panipatense]|uniref:Lysozyme n=1 Tax=Novosphingobium panipatense TaxID=428991 RepID=A0ABY1QL08_9SPHN|nr:glycoside hydrolase family protein [Novosphingobium panipatense]SMP74118.1 lysozyme [Novosphingobium panipatense]